MYACISVYTRGNERKRAIRGGRGREKKAEAEQNARLRQIVGCLCVLSRFPRRPRRPSFCHVQRIMHDFAARVASGEGRQTRAGHRTTARGIRGDFTRTIVNTGSATARSFRPFSVLLLHDR